MKILAWPARRNRRQNPFNFLLSEALAAEGCEVVELDRRNSLFGRFDVFHIHWPQGEASGTPLRASARSALLLIRLLLQRLYGARIVWTVHNVNAHDQNNPRMERALMRVVARLVHGAIYLTAASRTAACAELPALASKPFAVIPHGLYGLRSGKSRKDARAAFGLGPTAGVVGFLGDIRPYKGLDLLLDAYEKTPPGQATLFVAGAFADRDYGAIMRRRFAELVAGGHSVVLREERLDDEALVDAIRASDAVALPYRAIWNSGLAVLVIENSGRLIASDAPLFLELRSELGAERVQVAEGRLTAEALIAAVQPGAEDSRWLDGFCAARAWDRIGRDTVAFYRRLGAIGQRLNRAEAREMNV